MKTSSKVNLSVQVVGQTLKYSITTRHEVVLDTDVMKLPEMLKSELHELTKDASIVSEDGFLTSLSKTPMGEIRTLQEEGTEGKNYRMSIYTFQRVIHTTNTKYHEKQS
jgi:hypothetical protein